MIGDVARVAVIVGEFPVLSETFILRQITGLLDAGCDVDIYSLGRAPREERTHPEVRAYDLRRRTTYLHPPAGSSARRQAAGWLARALATAPGVTARALNPLREGRAGLTRSALYRLCALSARRGGYDVLHAHFGPVGNAVWYLSELWRAPLVVSFHGFDFTTWPRQHRPGAYGRLFDAARLVTGNSRYSRDRLRELGCPGAKLRQINYAVDLADVPFRAREVRPGEPVRLLSIARLVEKKGLEYAIRAVGEVRRRHPDVQYDIIGDGPLQQRLGALAAGLGLEQSVTFHGACDGAYVQHMLDRAHLFVLSSVTAADGDQEGTPVSLLEAQAAGLPVLSTRHSGIPEIVRDGETGYLLPERDVAGLAERIAYLVEHPECWAALGRRGRANVEARHDRRTLGGELLGLYRQAAA